MNFVGRYGVRLPPLILYSNVKQAVLLKSHCLAAHFGLMLMPSFSLSPCRIGNRIHPGLIRASLDSGKITAVPYIAPGSRIMTFKGLNGEPFPASLYAGNIRSVQSAGRNLPDRYPLDFAKALIVAPGVAFTPQGVRLGNGGGFYDAFLGSLERDIPVGSASEYAAVGICFSIQIVWEIPREPHDIGVQFVCTESGWFGTDSA